jgi:hypothetical protein
MNHKNDGERLADLFHGLNKPALNAYLALSTYKRTAAKQSAGEANKLLEEYVAELRKMLDCQSGNLEKSKAQLGKHQAIYTRYKEQFGEIDNILRTIAESAGGDRAEFDGQAKRLFEIDQDNMKFTNDVISETTHTDDK